jgi:hypothetical protein
MELELNKLYCDNRLRIVAKISGSLSATYQPRVGPEFINTIKQKYIEIENKGQTISQNSDSFVTDLFELQTKFSDSIFYRSTALLKKNIDDKDYYLDKYNIVKNKENTQYKIISIAIHKTIIRDKIIETHEALWKALRKYK